MRDACGLDQTIGMSRTALGLVVRPENKWRQSRLEGFGSGDVIQLRSEVVQRREEDEGGSN